MIWRNDYVKHWTWKKAKDTQIFIYLTPYDLNFVNNINTDASYAPLNTLVYMPKCIYKHVYIIYIVCVCVCVFVLCMCVRETVRGTLVSCTLFDSFYFLSFSIFYYKLEREKLGFKKMAFLGFLYQQAIRRDFLQRKWVFLWEGTMYIGAWGKGATWLDTAKEERFSM